MIKAVMIGVWAIILMAGSIYYFAIMAGAETKSSEKEDTRGLETFELQTSSYPVVRDGEIRGYIIMSALFTVVSKNAAKLPYPLDFQINDALLETFFADREIDVFQLERSVSLVPDLEDVVDRLSLGNGSEIDEGRDRNCPGA